MYDMQNVLKFIRERYGSQNIVLDILSRTAEKCVYQIRLPDGEAWLLRMYQVANDQDMVFSSFFLASVLTFLEERQYPAVRVIRSIDDEMVIVHDGWHCLMTTFVEGTPIDLSPDSFYRLGAILGKLHALPLIDDVSPALPWAGMLPSGELAYAQRQLERVQSLVPAQLEPRYEELLQAVSSMDRLEGLPLVCIHNDCHPANSISTSDGQVLLIDWEGAGLGPAVIDVGFLLASSDGAAPWTPLAPSDVYRPHQERIAAIIDGYRQYHVLTPDELEQLPDAIRFRSLVYGACHFASTIAEHGQEIQSQCWQIRYAAAEEIAAMAKRCF
jgi:Ser/Thr protein kinase RdoA (MazF antagonist)